MRKAGGCGQRGTSMEFDRFHAGLGDEGYMYCDRDATVITWSSFDPTYSSMVHNTHPWMLTDAEKRIVEAAIIECPCGGRFRFGNPPLCPHCSGDLSDLAPEPIYYVVLGRRIDGDVSPAW